MIHIGIGDGLEHDGLSALAGSSRKSVGHGTSLQACEHIAVADGELEVVATVSVFNDEALALEEPGHADDDLF